MSNTTNTIIQDDIGVARKALESTIAKLVDSGVDPEAVLSAFRLLDPAQDVVVEALTRFRLDADADVQAEGDYHGSSWEYASERAVIARQALAAVGVRS